MRKHRCRDLSTLLLSALTGLYFILLPTAAMAGTSGPGSATAAISAMLDRPVVASVSPAPATVVDQDDDDVDGSLALTGVLVGVLFGAAMGGVAYSTSRVNTSNQMLYNERRKREELESVKHRMEAGRDEDFEREMRRREGELERRYQARLKELEQLIASLRAERDPTVAAGVEIPDKGSPKP